MKRTGGARAALVVVLMMALTGCLRFEGDLEVSGDETVSGTLVFALSDQLAELSGQDGNALLEQLQAEEDLPEGASVEEYSQDGFSGATLTFDEIPFSEWNEGEGLNFAVDGDEITFEGNLDAGGTDVPTGADLEDPAFQEQLEMFGGMPEVGMTLTFPGDVLDSNGEISGNSVTWDTEALLAGESLTARAEGAGGFPVLVFVLLVLVVLAAAAVAFFLLGRSRRASAATAAAYPATDHPQTDVAGGTAGAAAAGAGVAPFVTPGTEGHDASGSSTGFSAPDPAAGPEPTASPEPTATPDPAVSPEPVASPDPTASAEPLASPDPAASPEPAAPAPVQEPAPLVEPTPDQAHPVEPTGPVDPPAPGTEPVDPADPEGPPRPQ